MGASDSTTSRTLDETDLWIPVDGETVAGIRFRPHGVSGPRPTVLMYTPYHSDDLVTYGSYYPSIEYLARHGYDVVAADMVGTGRSTGTVGELFEPREGRRAAAIVEWLAEREWSTGRIGMFGKSYGGINALAAAAERPDPLDAIVPIESPYQGYTNGYISPGGFELFGIGGEWLTRQQVLDVKPPTRRDPEGRWKDAWRERLEAVREREPWLFQFLDHETKDDYWADKDVPLERVRTPTFAVGGYRDGGYTTETIATFERIDAPKRLLLGPWRHLMPHRGHEVAIDLRAQMIEWFDRFLKDEANAATGSDDVVYWTERNGGGKEDAGVWRGREEWPRDADADTLAFAVTPSGLGPAEEFDAGTVADDYDPDQTVGVDSAEELVTAGVGPVDTGPDDVRSLTYESDPLTMPIEYTGTGAATVRLRPTTDDPQLAVRLVDVSPSGDARLVSYGHRRLRYRNGAADPEPVVPGEEYTVRVPLEPKSHVFEAGHRLRLAFSAAYFPVVPPTDGHGPTTVLSTPDAPTELRFPGARFENQTRPEFDPVPMPGPDRSIPVQPPHVSNGRVRWETNRERVEDRATVRTTASTTVDCPQAHIESNQETTATVLAGDPATAVLRSEAGMTIDDGTGTVEIEAVTRWTPDTTVLRTTVTLDGATYFEQRWSR